MKVLIDFRRNSGKSPKEMAALIGVSQSYYEKVEYDQKRPSREFLIKFKKAFPTFDIDLFFAEWLHDTRREEATA
jgi:transcriptional regulator with XRE-family HTH domain